MLIDPLSNNPLTITGSANFSNGSTKNNDEHMLIIQGDQRVADIYLGEFLRMFNHFYVRNLMTSYQDQPGHHSIHLLPDDSWRENYYKKNSAKQKERVYFAG
jgi:phosphatidylserine/phosphatidylglycerophosphate/cardiolipin synthase-like enzyme